MRLAAWCTLSRLTNRGILAKIYHLKPVTLTLAADVFETAPLPP